MTHHPCKAYLLCLLLALPGFTEAQKTIIISDSLSANSDKLNVNMGGLWLGSVRKFSFGDYAIVSSKGMGTTTQKSETRVFKDQTDTRTRNFTFVMNDKTTDSANVHAGTQSTIVQSLRTFGLGNGWSLGSDAVTESDNFAAQIIINHDTSDIWALLVSSTSRNELGYSQAYLTNGKRKILLTPASSNKKVQNTGPFNAVGYEFIENGQSLCAVQYHAGFVRNPHIVWIQKSQDAKMKLVLASAMTAILLVNSPASPIN